MEGNTLNPQSNVLLLIEDQFDSSNTHLIQQIHHLKNNFFGTVIENINFQLDENVTTIYLTGDILLNKVIHPQVLVIKELSFNYDQNCLVNHVINIGSVPLNIFNTGVFFPQILSEDNNYFNIIKNNHIFQQLTESNKQSFAYRLGIYLSPVQELENGDLKYGLLRCSTNFRESTDNFRDIDHYIVNHIQNLLQPLFSLPFTLNHVLAQIYQNQKINGKEKKAVIKAHSDKTKDMPRNGLIVFTTFYDIISNKKQYEFDGYDIKYKGESIFPRLLFKLKKDVYDKNLKKEFSIPLYPNSVFAIPLSTNRLYTHEIKASKLSIDLIPTRMGYVIRCSNTIGVYKNGTTYIGNEMIGLHDPSIEETQEIKRLYLKENFYSNIIEYPQTYFSLNEGDYKPPRI